MALGRRKEVEVKHRRPTEEEKAKQEIAIQKKLEKLKSATMVPPAINQFSVTLSDHETGKVVELFKKYRPENKDEKKERLSKEDPREGPRPVLVKFGLKHVTSLIETKKAKLVLIAASVHPIENVLFLPTLCKKMGVAYAIVREQETLGVLVNLKRTTCVCLCETRPEDAASFEELVTMCNATFSDKYERHMKTWGGSSKAEDSLTAEA
jgi:large subunit ribosomal protein L7Ae